MFVAWIGLCFVAAFLLRNRPLVLIVATVVIWAAIPSVAGELITRQPSGSLSFHPASWLILATTAVLIVFDTRSVLDEIGRRIFVYLALVLFLSVAFLATKTSASGSGLVLFIDVMLAPVLLFMITNVALARHPGGLLVLRNWVIGIAAVEGGFALVQKLLGSVVLYRTFYQTQYWFDEVRFPRWMGTLDHPLTLSLLLCVAVPLVAGIRSVWLQIPLLAVMGLGAVATASRTGLGVVALGIVYVVVTAKVRPVAKVVAIAVLGVAAYFLATSVLVQGVADRLQNDTGSSLARGAALDFFLAHVDRFFLTGGGIGSSYEIADLAGLTTSLESSILIYAVDVGVLFSLIYFGVQLVIALRSIGPSVCPGLTFAAFLVVIVPQTYNALGARTIAGILVWLILAMAASMTSRRRLDNATSADGTPVADLAPSKQLPAHPV